MADGRAARMSDRIYCPQCLRWHWQPACTDVARLAAERAVTRCPPAYAAQTAAHVSEEAAAAALARMPKAEKMRGRDAINQARVIAQKRIAAERKWRKQTGEGGR